MSETVAFDRVKWLADKEGELMDRYAMRTDVESRILKEGMTRKDVIDQLGDPKWTEEKEHVGWIRWDPAKGARIVSAVRYPYIHIEDKDTAIGGDIVIGFDGKDRLVAVVED